MPLYEHTSRLRGLAVHENGLKELAQGMCEQGAPLKYCKKQGQGAATPGLGELTCAQQELRVVGKLFQHMKTGKEEPRKAPRQAYPPVRDELLFQTGAPLLVVQ